MQEKETLEYFIRRMKGRDLQMAYEIQNSVANHIESFNFLYETGLKNIAKYMNPVTISYSNIRNHQCRKELFKTYKIWFEELKIGYPTKTNDYNVKEARLFPSECRVNGGTYNAPLICTIVRQVDDGQIEKMNLNLGEIPIMVRSKHCHLHNLDGQSMVNKYEDYCEFGGYFVLNGLEKLIRLLVIQKQNYPVGFIRNSYMNRMNNFTGYAVQMRTVREDLYQRTITLHYLNDGSICARLIHRKQEFLIPLVCILKSLVEATDKQIYRSIIGNQLDQEEEQLLKDRIEMLLRSQKQFSILNRNDNLKYIGNRFRLVLTTDSSLTDVQVGIIFIKEHILVNSENNHDKFNTLCLMANKLYLLANHKIQPDNLDSLNTQEVLLPGHLYTMILKEKLEEILLNIQLRIQKDMKTEYESQKILDLSYLKKCVEQQSNIGKKMEYFLATGNLRSQTGLDLMQQNGFVIQADKINNMRFLANFRSIHRGAYFTEMKTTTVRKLLPEQWGFICPVHTPDGSPCGLLNHLSIKSVVVQNNVRNGKLYNQEEKIKALCQRLGMVANQNSIVNRQIKDSYFVLMNGKVIGYVCEDEVDSFYETFKYYKINQTDDILSNDIEIVLAKKEKHLKVQSVYPGIYINTNTARLTRAVKHLRSEKEEYISPFEQLFLSIACQINDIRRDSEYMEYNSLNILSILASNVPLLVHNQSPRNMYQCQMAKQTLGTPYHNNHYRFDNKSFVIGYPQLPILKPLNFEEYGMSDYPSGTNAVVAVISYTGYDMEDAMILNKSAYERGFGHASVYKSKRFQLNDDKGSQFKKSKYKMLGEASRYSVRNKNLGCLMKDGTPPVNQLLKKGEPEFAVYDSQKQEVKVQNYKDQEQSRIHQVVMYSAGDGTNDVNMALKYRYNRNPIIGDKFSSRHGQKGVLSVLLPQIDMPFSESGITPDIIINPNAFPSRMTIGMLIESLAGKQGSLDGKIHQTIPFEQYKNDDTTGYFGEQLIKHGYNYYGTESMYSGMYGDQMKCDIFIGIDYQRLRHMVNDKYQARATGPVDILTQQPVKGRKKHGGIRLGEMERDALLAHGTSFVLHDRLFNSSDHSYAYICDNCGSLLSSFVKTTIIGGGDQEMGIEQSMMKNQTRCISCQNNECSKVAIPFVLRYLTNELAAMNIKLTYTTR